MLHRHDAVGQHTLAVQALLRARGVSSEVYVELDDPDTAGQTRPFRRYADDAGPGDVLVYQVATDSDLADWIVGRPEHLVVNYHNITPPELFAPWDTSLALHQVRARHQLEALARCAVLGVAVSEYNRGDLVRSGFSRTEVVPPAIDAAALVAPAGDGMRPDSGHAHAHAHAHWLSVGRIAPNKALEDTLAALLWYRSTYDPHAELRVVGRPAVAPYAEALSRFTADLGLTGAVRYDGSVTSDQLRSAYATSDVLVVTSEHEGFCLPVVEAFAHQLPVVAFRQGALPEVMGESGVLLDRKSPQVLADAVHGLLTDEQAHKEAVERGTERVRALDLATAGTRLVDLLCRLRDQARPPGR